MRLKGQPRDRSKCNWSDETIRLMAFKYQNKAKPTVAERVANQVLCGLGLSRIKQKLSVPYLVDFFIPKYKAAIEIDGEYHDTREEYDERRADRILSDHPDWIMLRYTNDFVLNHTASFREAVQIDLGL